MHGHNDSGESPKRLHSLDALRATAMLLGVFLHSTHSFGLFMLSVEGFEWQFWAGIRDSSATPVSAILLEQVFSFFHAFRMHAFFLVAGFFAHLLYNRGAMAMVRNRAARILVPFLAGTALLIPLVTAIRLWGRARAEASAAGIPWDAIGRHFLSRDFLHEFNPHYLWFLLYLLVFYVVLLILMPALASLGFWGPLSNHADRLMGRLCRSKWAPAHLAAPTFIVLLLTRSPQLAEEGRSFMPEPGLVLFYGLFFAFGWALYRRQTLLEALAGNWAAYFGCGMVLFALTVVFSVGMSVGQLREGKGTVATAGRGEAAPAPPSFAVEGAAAPADLPQPPARGQRGGAGQPPPPPIFLGMRLITALLSWSLTLAAVGFFMRYLNHPHRLARYVADSSYWIYLAHVPLLMPLQIAMAYWPLPWWLKLPLLNLVLAGILFVLYDLCVRPTWVGAVLNGRRYPAEIPALLGRVRSSGE